MCSITAPVFRSLLVKRSSGNSCIAVERVKKYIMVSSGTVPTVTWGGGLCYCIMDVVPPGSRSGKPWWHDTIGWRKPGVSPPLVPRSHSKNIQDQCWWNVHFQSSLVWLWVIIELDVCLWEVIYLWEHSLVMSSIFWLNISYYCVKSDTRIMLENAKFGTRKINLFVFIKLSYAKTKLQIQ